MCCLALFKRSLIFILFLTAVVTQYPDGLFRDQQHLDIMAVARRLSGANRAWQQLGAMLPLIDDYQDFVIRHINGVLRGTFGGSITADRYRSGSQGSMPILCPTDLDCSFGYGESCRWNSLEGDLGFFRGSGTIDLSISRVLLKTVEPPDDGYILTITDSNPVQISQLISDPIALQPDDGEISFKFWATPMARIRVCVKELTAVAFDFCEEIKSSETPGPVGVKIPGPILEEFRIHIVIDNFVVQPGAVVLIDEIRYTSNLCDVFGPTRVSSRSQRRRPMSSRPAFVKEGSRRPGSGIRTSDLDDSRERSIEGRSKVAAGLDELCSTVACNFDDGDCGYHFERIKSTDRPFYYHRGEAGDNKLTGIFVDEVGDTLTTNDGFLLAKKSNQSDRFIALSNRFSYTARHKVKLELTVYSATFGTKLLVCIDQNGGAECLLSHRKVNRAWVRLTVRLPRHVKDGRLVVVAENLHRMGYAGIDNIDIIDDLDQSYCR